MNTTEVRSATPVTPDSVGGGDIDANESSCDDCYRVMCSLLPENSSDQYLQSILRHESLFQYQVSPDYLHSSVLVPSTEEDQGVSERCRRRTCEWMYDICDYFHLNREVVAIALFYVDRYFTLTSFPNTGCSNGYQKQIPVTRRRFQLVSLTALYIAIKTHGQMRTQGKSIQGQWSRIKFNVHVCASISRHQFSAQAIEECEKSMLQTLNWRINPVVPSGGIIDTLVSYLSPIALDGSESTTGVALYVYDCSKYLAELSVSVPALSMVYKPSVIAFASIMYALDSYGTKFSAKRRSEYENALRRASCHHFDTEKDNIESARGILQVICPNLSELFRPQLTKEPVSPNSVRMSDKI
ncbi:hypothetical protein HJC23_005330 [Cyclotella cryptica]|uniref:Cyclin N-terminal domain-containing protein n=1 Tax=Cyclotella cryptica TaxID=29204 RepID=A0ABD3P722_9STRA